MNADRRKARSGLANAAKKASRNPEDQTAASEVDRLRSTYRTLVLAERIRDEIPESDVDAWAAGVADALSPLSPTEAAAVGRLAAALDARLRDSSGGGQLDAA